VIGPQSSAATSETPPGTVTTVTTSSTETTSTTVTVTSTATRSSSSVPAPHSCVGDGSCTPVATQDFGGGQQLVVVLDGTQQQAVLVGGSSVLAVGVIKAVGNHPDISCKAVGAAEYCLIAGVPGAHTAFGSVVVVSGQTLRVATTDLFGEGGALALTAKSSDGVLAAGATEFAGYGLAYAYAPQAWQTWQVTGGGATSTGCGVPSIGQVPTAPTVPQTGPCSGTPAVDGFGPDSAHRLGILGTGFVTPSGNQRCVYNAGAQHLLACGITAIDFPRPACTKIRNVVGTLALMSDTQPPYLDGCMGDILAVAGLQKAAYDTFYLDADGFGCLVTQSQGVTCRNPQGHGFRLARAGFSAF
jgi:hypothetical protein